MTHKAHHIQVAESMLGMSRINLSLYKVYPDLAAELDDIHRLCQQEGGSLRSRQIIAMIIYNYQERNSK